MRLILDNSREKTVSLEDEMLAITNYVELQKARFSSVFDYRIEVDENVNQEHIYVPPMLIQPFVENSIEHGFRNKEEKGVLSINMYFQSQDLVCEITDNGIGVNQANQMIESSQKSQVSTGITAERMRLLAKEFKCSASVSITDRSEFNEEGTFVKLVIPYITDHD